MNAVGSVRRTQDSSSSQGSRHGRAAPSVLTRLVVASSLIIAGLWIAACGGGGDTSPPDPVGSVTVDPVFGPLVSIGQTVQLTVHVADVNGNPMTGQTVTWSSSNTAVATVSSAGLVTAVSNGTATITATAEGVSGTAAVTVAQVITSLEVTPGASTLVSFGATIQLTATPKDANGHPVPGQTATWSSSDNGIATVSAAGLVTAVANGGPVTITATVGAFSATATATVAQVVANVAVTPGVTTLVALGATVQLSAAPTDANGNPVAGQTVTWSSSNSGVAHIGPTGLVTAMAPGGPVTLTATVGGKSGTATVTVTQAVEAVAVAPPATTLVSFGETLQLTATATDINGITIDGVPFTWSSSNTSVATVSATGLVTAVANGGPVTITASAGIKSGTATVSVAQVVNTVGVTPGSTSLTAVGATVQLAAAPQDANGNPVIGQTITWTSSNTAVATVNNAGLVTAVGNGGPVTITASTGGKSGTASVTVAQVVDAVVVTPGATTLAALGATVQLSAAPTDANGNPVAGQTVTWSSSNPGVAQIGPTGLVTAMATGGPVTLTATVGGKSGTATVTVTQAVEAVAVTPPATTLVSFGETLQLTATATDANGATINGVLMTWSSSNSSVATVSATGLVTAVANGGPVTITASAGGKSGTATVSVAQVVNAVAVTPPTPTLASFGATTQLTAAPTDANGNPVAGQTATWSSADNTIATVSASGLVTAVANGTVTVTATIGSKSGTATVTVAQVAAAVTITTQPSATVQNGVAFPAVPVVTVRDALGNALVNPIPVAVSVATGSALTFTNGTATTNTSGVATFTGLVATGVTGARTLRFTAGTAVSVPSSVVSITAGLPAAATITTQPAATVQSGETFSTVPVITVTDLSGNPVPSQAVTVSVASGGALIFANGTATTDANGLATFTGLTATGLIGARTLQFTAGTAVSAPSATVTVSGGAPATVTITTQPSATVQSGVTFPTVPVVTVTDGAGNVVPNQAVTVSVASGSALTFTNGSATTNASGVASFTGLAASGLVGARTLRFTAGTVQSAASNSVTVNAGLPAAVAISTQPAAAVQSGVTFPTVPVVTVTDGGGNPVSGQAVTVSVVTGGALTFTNGSANTDGSGVATFTGLSASGLIGARTLRFTAGAAQSAASNSVTVNAGLPAAVAITTQPPAAVQSGAAFSTAPAVTVTDGSGNLVPSQAVTVSVASGGALTFTNGSATTDVDGIATFTGLSASGLAGDRTLRFTAGTAQSAASSTVTVSGGAAAIVTITTQPAATVQSGVTFPTVPVVTVTDGAGNPVADQAVTVSVLTGGALTFTNGSATTNASGVATFTGLAASGLIGGRTLRFTAGAAQSAASNSVTVSAGLPAAVAITTQPAATVQSGVTFPTVPAVTVTDGSGNLVPSQAVTVSVVTGGALTFTNGSATTNAFGVATFTGLAGTGIIGARTLQFTAGTAQSAASNSVTVNAGLPAAVAISTQPAAAVQSGVVFPTVPVVTVTDGSGNLVPSQAVTVSVATGSALTFTNGSATTNVNGIATFTGLVASGLAGDRTLRFTAGTAQSAASSTVSVAAGTPAAVAITTQPSATVQSGVTFPTVPVVTVTDGGGNPVAGQTVTVSVATGTALTFTNGSATTNASGVATFTGLSASGLIGARTLRFTAGAANSVASATVTVGAGLAATVTITTQPSGTVQSGVVFPTVPAVTVRDGATNLVPSQSVTVSVASGSALTFTSGTATTNGSGVATFTGLIATGVIGVRTLQFTAGTAVSAASNSVTVNGGAPAAVAITTQPAAAVQSGVVFPTVPVVTVTDGGGNPVAAQAVTVSVVSGPALTFTNGSATTDASGIATFTGLSASGLIGARTLRFTAGTANSVASATVTVSAGLPATVTITTQPSATVQSGVTFPIVPVVTVRDGATNLVPSVPVTVSVASGSPLTFTNGIATTSVTGVATFTGLAATGLIGSRTLQFTAGTAVSVPSTTVTVTTGTLGKIVVTPATTMLLTAGNTQQLAYSAQDSAGNPLNPQPAVTSWTSSNAARATVNATGLVTAGASTGTVTITAAIGTVTGIAHVMVGQVAVVTHYKGGSVSILNGTTVQNTVVTGDSVLDVAITPDGTKAYVTNNFGGDMSVVRLGPNTVVNTINLTAPRGIAMPPTGNLVFVTSGFPTPNMWIMDTVTNSPFVNFKAGASPRYMVATATDVWVTDSGTSLTQGQVMRYNRSQGRITDSIPVGGAPYGLALNGTTLYVTNRDGNSVSVINTSTLAVIATITDTTFHKPWGVAVTPNGTVYVANSDVNTVSVISTATNTVTGRIVVGSNPVGIAVTAAGTAYVANFGSNSVSLINTATNAVTGSVAVGNGPLHIALRRVQ